MRKGTVDLGCWPGGVKRGLFDNAVQALRGRGVGLIKLTWHEGIGVRILTKRLGQDQFA